MFNVFLLRLRLILHSQTQLTVNSHTIITDIRRDVSELREGVGNQGQAVSDTFECFLIHTDRFLDSGQVCNPNYRDNQPLTSVSSAHGELPPPQPRIFFGRDELIEEVVHLTELLTPIALIGAGGIGKTSVILTTLHDYRIKRRFGENRRFIRCDQFPATRNHFLRRLSKVVGAGIENPEDLACLRPFLSSKEILIVLDNAESILDLQGPSGREIYADIDELVQLGNICICITSRISSIPPGCETFEIATLSAEAAHDTFYRIYKYGEQPEPINNILKQLDFHPLSVTLLATVAQHNKWGTDRVVMEWERQRTGVLHIQNSGGPATTIELSLASPTFRELGADARPLLEVVAFLPQGVNEKNADWSLTTISNVPAMLDTFCALSLAHRNEGFITMLAPLRDHLRPKDPGSSPLLGTIKDNYFNRLSGEIHPGKPGFEEARWITWEDINVEYLLDVFTTVDANSRNIWNTCIKFLDQLYWHKSRLVTLGPKIEALPDGHPSKAECLRSLSRLFNSVGNHVERKRLLTHSLKLWRERGDDFQVARTLRGLSNANRGMGLHEEGIRQAREASEIFGRLGHAVEQADSLIILAFLLCEAKQLDAAEEAGLRALDLLPEKGEELSVCQAQRVLGSIYQFKGKTEKAIHHFKAALGIATSLGLVTQLFWVNHSLADVFSKQGKFEDAQTFLESAKSHAAADMYLSALATDQQARVWGMQHRFVEARSEASRALEAFEKLGAVNNAEITTQLLQWIDAKIAGQPSR